LEEQGLLESEWNVEGSRPRRYYQISSIGGKLLGVLTDDWLALVTVMKDLLLSEKE
jgi:DNA-binding PadR family transcriptional regulator